jgi:hypothetical protein
MRSVKQDRPFKVFKLSCVTQLQIKRELASNKPAQKVSQLKLHAGSDSWQAKLTHM